jgi:hypothetical protein
MFKGVRIMENSYLMLVLMCRTSTFVEQLITSESPLEEGVKPLEMSFWAKYVSWFELFWS